MADQSKVSRSRKHVMLRQRFSAWRKVIYVKFWRGVNPNIGFKWLEADIKLTVSMLTVKSLAFEIL